MGVCKFLSYFFGQSFIGLFFFFCFFFDFPRSHHTNIIQNNIFQKKAILSVTEL